MNISAIVLVETEPGKSRDVARKIAGIPGIISSFPVTGPYDVIAAVSFKHLENMTSIVLPAVQTVPGVKKTVTCIREDAS